MGSSSLFADTPIAPLLPGSKIETSGAADEPVVVFAGASFSDEQKESITKKLVQPYTMYHQLTDKPLATVKISKAQSGELEIDYIHRDGTYGGFLHNLNSLWYPTCKGQCALPDDFSELYPTIADKIRSL